MSTVAVVGAAGIIGPAIVATLAEQEAVQEIRCLDVNADGARGSPSGTAAARPSAGRWTSPTVMPLAPPSPARRCC